MEVYHRWFHWLVLFLLRQVKVSSVKRLWRKGAKPLPLLKYWNLAFNFCTFLCFQDFGTLFDCSQDFDLEIYFTHEFSCTYFLSVLHMKPFPVTVHCLLLFVAFLLLVDPKRDMWTPESTLLTSGLILPHVPGMKHLIFICFVHICIQISSLSCIFFFPFLHVLVRKILKNDVTESS